MSPLRPLAERFEGAPYNADLGFQIDTIEPDRVQVRLPFKDAIANPGGALHGGVTASSINVAGVLAAWTGIDPRPNLRGGTLDLGVNYLAAAIEEDIVATAEVLRRGKEIVYSAVTVRNDGGKRIAAGLVTYRIVDPAAVAQAGSRQRHAPAEPLPAEPSLIRGAAAFVSFGFIARLGMQAVHAADGCAVLCMPPRPETSDADGTVHEGALAALIDTAGALASWSVVGLNLTYKASTVGIHVNYHGPARDESVVASARTLRRDNEIFLNQVTVSGQTSGHVVATGSVTYRIVVPD